MGFLKPHKQCCGAGATRSRKFQPDTELVFEVSTLGQTKVVYKNHNSYLKGANQVN